jgi:hypothetical protein
MSKVSAIGFHRPVQLQGGMAATTLAASVRPAAAGELPSSIWSILEVVMLAPVDALPPTADDADRRQRRQAVAQSVQDRCDLCEFDRPDIGRDAYPLINRTVGLGPVVVAGVWLAFYAITASYPYLFGN